ncbi:MAG: hypothetical protein KDB14_21065 [Planctomycetales bacterium]|nr:hypothetical protein [Planctomycetales bacterium]
MQARFVATTAMVLLIATAATGWSQSRDAIDRQQGESAHRSQYVWGLLAIHPASREPLPLAIYDLRSSADLAALILRNHGLGSRIVPAHLSAAQLATQNQLAAQGRGRLELLLGSTRTQLLQNEFVARGLVDGVVVPVAQAVVPVAPAVIPGRRNPILDGGFDPRRQQIIEQGGFNPARQQLIQEQGFSQARRDTINNAGFSQSRRDTINNAGFGRPTPPVVRPAPVSPKGTFGTQPGQQQSRTRGFNTQ